MVSANVSGRGTPSISGRDTPISQEESQADGAEEERRAPNLPVTVQKKNREDVTDKFGKFDIKQELESTLYLIFGLIHFRILIKCTYLLIFLNLFTELFNIIDSGLYSIR